MAVTSYELIQVAGDFVTADDIVWRRYRCRSTGIVEKLLDANPQLSFVHRYTPFIPPGTYVRIPIDPDILAGKPQKTPIKAWTDVYTN